MRIETVACWLSIASTLATGFAQADAMEEDLFELSLEELLNIDVTSASRTSEAISQTAAAVFVITSEDIERHGIRTIPDALRLAPGLSASQINANTWAVGMREQNGQFTNKLLVLQDGRIIYSPTYSAVFWDVQATLIEEIDRIEVIRGPGAAVWGSNAVNGVINIITKTPDSDDASMLVGGLEPDATVYAGVQHSAELGPADVRFFMVHRDTPSNQFERGGDANDDWTLTRAGVRAAIQQGDSSWRMQMEAYTGEIGEVDTRFDPTAGASVEQTQYSNLSGGFVMLGWTLNGDDGQETNLDVIVDHTDRDGILIGERRSTYSVDFRHQRSWLGQNWVTGFQFRSNRYDERDTAGFRFDPTVETIDGDSVFAGFAQTQMILKPDELFLTLGAKLEHNQHSERDLEFMPTIRARWQVSPDFQIWGAISRSVRTPSLAEESVTILDAGAPIPVGSALNPFPVPLRTAISGDTKLDSVVLEAFELGLRGRLGASLAFDLALFKFRYDRNFAIVFEDDALFCYPAVVSINVDPSCLITADSVVTNGRFVNSGDAKSRGAEIVLDWVPNEDLRVSTTVSYSRDRKQNPQQGFPVPTFYPGLQGQLRVEYEISDDLQAGITMRYVDNVVEEALLVDIDEYWKANVNLRWAARENLVIQAGIRNAFRSDSVEWVSEYQVQPPVEISATAYLNLRYSF